MKKIAALCMTACLLLTGCNTIFDGSYVSVTPHKGQSNHPISQTVSAENYTQLRQVLTDMIHNGTEECLISVVEYYQANLQRDMERVVEAVLAEDPIAAYAADTITYEIGTNQGQPAVVVLVSYVHDRTEIQKILEVTDEEAAKSVIAAEISRYSTGVVLYAKDMGELDYAQWVEDYGAFHPEMVMEIPEVTVNLYPQEGAEQVVELKFTYQHSRDLIREMQTKVDPIFEAAKLYVSGSEDERGKFAQLYAFLMERFEEHILETSITPAYSLLLYGVGDSRAFANVYGAMCRQAGLECVTVSGTRMGEAWHWNLVKVDGIYYHLDLLASHRDGAFRLLTDDQMSGYVWDYSAHPASGVS